MKQDENGRSYEMHVLKCGEQIWMYSDTLHKMYQLADVYGYDIEKGSDFNKIKQLVNN